MSLYAALLAPLAWRLPAWPARMLHGFARAERGSHADLLQAANRTASPARRALYLRHALDEARHATMFAQRSADLARAAGRAPLGPALADTEQLFERLGELGFLAFVHLGEARGRAQFVRHARACRGRGDVKSAALFEAILVDETRHAAYTRDLLVEVAGGEAAARAALRRARAWEAWRGFRRLGRASAHAIYAVCMIVLYLATAPLALIVRLGRPARGGWTGPPPAGADATGARALEAPRP